MQCLLAIVTILGHILNVIALRGIVNDKGQQYTYVFTYPHLMIAGRHAQACLTLYNFTLPVKLSVKFVRNKCTSSTQTGCNNVFTIADVQQCFNLEVPMFSNGMVYDTLEIDIEAERRQIVKKGRRDVAIVSKRQMIFVETDHAIYKPEDEIRIRLLALQFSMSPVETPLVVNVVLQGPNHVKVRQWPNLTIASGIAEVTYKLQEHAQAGFWKLEVNGVLKATIEVKRYTLARFETILNYPQYLFWGDGPIVIGLCSSYTFNEPLQGIGTIEAIRSSEGKEMSPISKTEKLVNGCMKMELYAKQLVLNNRVYHNIEITGTVVEYGTNISVAKIGSMTLNSAPYDMMNEQHRLKPGLPFSGHLHIRDKNMVATEQNVTMCYTHRESSKPHSVCKTVLVKDENVIPFTIPPLRRVQHHVTVEAYIQNVEDKKYYTRPSIQLEPFYSITNNSLLIMPLSKDIYQCGDKLKFDVMYTLNNITKKVILFNYMLISRFELIQAGSKLIKPSNLTFNSSKFENVIMSSDDSAVENINFDYFSVEIELDRKVYTDVKLIVFYVTNGEVIADDMPIHIDKCLPNQVVVQWEQNEVVPNSKTNLKIMSTKGSLCAITATDVASSFMRKQNMLTPQDILLPFEILDIKFLVTNERNCLIPEEDTADTHAVWINGIHLDAHSIFNDNKIGVISNLNVITKPCAYMVVDTEKKYRSEVRHLSDEPDGFMMHDKLHRLVKEDLSLSKNRTFFPQTWLWDALIISDSEILYEVNVPSSITRWNTNVLCLNSEGGMGISNPVQLSVKKPFFVELILPYSVKRNIQLIHMQVVVHNYFKHNIPVIIALQKNNFIKNIDGESSEVKYCIRPEGMITHTFNFIALQIGVLNVSVNAQVMQNAVENCDNGEIMNLSDTIHKSIRIEPEAYEEHVLKSGLICTGDWGKSDVVRWELSVPEDQMVLNVESHVTIDSNIFSPLIENVEFWIRTPTGPAETIISAIVTNYYAFRYVKTNHMTNKHVTSTAKKNLRLGSQKLYGYFHNDGMLVDNDNSNTLSSIFTTALAVRLLGAIREQVPIENATVARAVVGLMTYQQSNGCFNIYSHEEEDTQTTSLTSFIMISLIESGITISPHQKASAVECLLKEENSDNYDTAISTYALFLMGSDERANSNLESLINRSVRLGNLMYWKQNTTQWSKRGVDVEVAAYVLMSLLHKGTADSINYARLIVRWFLTNPQQGQYSTQDIMVILEGIYKFSELVNANNSILTLNISSTVNGVTTFHLRPGTEHVTKVANIYKLPDFVNITASGKGCVLVKGSLEFNTYSSDMALDIHANILSQCKCTIALTSCLTTNSTERSLIAILKVRIPKGYAFDEKSLLSLEKDITGIRKYENSDYLVLLHFTGITRNKKCATITIQETLEIQHKTNITMKLYNYYAADAAMHHHFLLPSCYDLNITRESKA